jgi:hypothetical protein
VRADDEPDTRPTMIGEEGSTLRRLAAFGLPACHGHRDCQWQVRSLTPGLGMLLADC